MIVPNDCLSAAVAGGEQGIWSEMDPIIQQGSLDIDLDFITTFSLCHSRPNRREEFWGFGLEQRTLENSNREKICENLILHSGNS